MAGKTGRWSLQDAKAQFSEVVRRSLAGHPQRVSRNGEDAVVVVSAREFDRMTRPRGRSLARTLAESPLSTVDLDIRRSRETGRKIDV